ncbi:hypothetical protein SRHO_G00185350 [Serrasalmus rhombeus]
MSALLCSLASGEETDVENSAVGALWCSGQDSHRRRALSGGHCPCVLIEDGAQCRSDGMALRRLFQLSSLLGSAVRVTLRRNIGLSAVLLNRAKELDPVQKLFVDKIREYNVKSKSAGGVVDAGPNYQKNMTEEITKLQRLYGGGDMAKFPDFKFPEPKLDEVAK